MNCSTFLESHNLLPVKDNPFAIYQKKDYPFTNTFFVNICSHLASRLGMGAPKVHQVQEMERLLREMDVADDKIETTPVFIILCNLHLHYADL
jgi:hypothetical protein